MTVVLVVARGGKDYRVPKNTSRFVLSLVMVATEPGIMEEIRLSKHKKVSLLILYSYSW